MGGLLNQSMGKMAEKPKKPKNNNNSTYNTKPISVRLTPSEQDELLQRSESVNKQISVKITRMMMMRIAVKYLAVHATDDDIIDIYRDIRSNI